MTSSPVDDERVSALAAVSARLVARARQDAEEHVAAARAEAETLLDVARERAGAIIDEARSQGEALVVAEKAQALAGARRQARSLELSAQRAVYDEVCDAITSGVRGLRDADDYPLMLRELERRARLVLGADAEIVEAPGGGLTARRPGRVVDLSLASIAAEAVDRLDGEVAELWTP
ncbi:MAG TPA: hypothetical protein VL551_25445 [Actinospica sp.]|jgi:vacuolar-type H+-ATPase subunit E/Vma4|nr:hypothetical protein [Actinospica sp.]